MSLSRYFFAPAVLAASLGVAALAAPAPAQAQSDDLIRVLVSVADVVMRGNTPYYRNSDYGREDRLVAQRDQYGRAVYYRTVPRDQYYGNAGYNGYNGNNNNNNNSNNERYRTGQPPYGNAYGYYGDAPVTGRREVKCNKHGKCKTTYYDPRYDRDGRAGYDKDDRYEHNDRDHRDRDDRRSDDRRWRERN